MLKRKEMTGMGQMIPPAAFLISRFGRPPPPGKLHMQTQALSIKHAMAPMDAKDRHGSELHGPRASSSALPLAHTLVLCWDNAPSEVMVHTCTAGAGAGFADGGTALARGPAAATGFTSGRPERGVHSVSISHVQLGFQANCRRWNKSWTAYS